MALSSKLNNPSGLLRLLFFVLAGAVIIWPTGDAITHLLPDLEAGETEVAQEHQVATY